MKKFVPTMIRKPYKKFLFSLSCTYIEDNKQTNIPQPSYTQLNF